MMSRRQIPNQSVRVVYITRTYRQMTVAATVGCELSVYVDLVYNPITAREINGLAAISGRFMWYYDTTY